MNNFPDFHESRFDINEYNKTFETKNVIIHASAKNVSYANHWGPLSMKCTIKGAEHYQCNNRFYSVDENCYLILNNGQYYSSYIYSDTATESFTINFSTELLQCVLKSFSNNPDEIFELKYFEFIEKIYQHDPRTQSLLKILYKEAAQQKPDILFITEKYYSLLENLLLQQIDVKEEIKKIDAVKYSTQLELYKRLHYAKDFIHSCYMNAITIDTLASVSCLNTAYFLREFKKYFGITPHQYIMQRRLNAAKKLLETTSNSIAEICFAVGYEDVNSFSKLFKKNFQTTPLAYQSGKTKKSFFTS
ncbi:MAG: AraC family transcriptional regulator [Parafilimonas sp.]